MKIIDELRYQVFKWHDAFNKNPISKYMMDIEVVNESFTSVEIKNYQKEKIKDLFNQIKTTIPYYQGTDSFDKAPIIDKNIILSNYDAFVDKTQLETAKKVSTSGSTGIPFKTYWCKKKVKKNRADTLYFLKKIDFKYGQRTYYFRVWNKTNKIGYIGEFLRNIVPIDISKLDSDAALKVLKMIELDKSDKKILGYASSIQAFYDLISHSKKRFNGNIKGIVTMAEGLSNNVRNNISQYFNCPIIERYSNSENGLIAHKFDSNDYFDINHSSYLVEIVKFNSDVSTAIGEIGRIIITDLFNTAMPFIRYDTGDLGTWNYDEKGRMKIESIEGRKLDAITDTSNTIVSPHVIDYIVRNIKGIKQFQLIQEEKDLYFLKLNCSSEFIEDMKVEIINNLKNNLGEDARINIETVEEIPLISSGKFKMVINNYQIKKQ